MKGILHISFLLFCILSVLEVSLAKDGFDKGGVSTLYLKANINVPFQVSLDNDNYELVEDYFVKDGLAQQKYLLTVSYVENGEPNILYCDYIYIPRGKVIYAHIDNNREFKIQVQHDIHTF